MSSLTMRPCGDFRTSYKQDNTIYETKTIRNVAIIAIALLCCAPFLVDAYFLTLFIQISYLLKMMDANREIIVFEKVENCKNIIFFW